MGEGQGEGDSSPISLPIEDRWILSRLNRTIEDVTRALTSFRLGDAQEYVHDFIWNEFCDWYIEIAKVRLRDNSDSPSPAPVLAHVLESSLRLLHPFMPFITEEIWQSLVQRIPDSPRPPRLHNDRPLPHPRPLRPSTRKPRSGPTSSCPSSAASATSAPSARSKPGKKVPAVLTGWRDPWRRRSLLPRKPRPLHRRGPSRDAPQPENSIMVVEKATRVFLPLAGLFDFAGERQRLESSLEDLRKRIGQVQSRLSNEQFLSKAPANVVEKERTRLSGWQEEESNLLQRLAELNQ